MIRYWSLWNFIWWLHHDLKGKKYENPLKTSIFMTSLFGGFLIHVYPRSFTLRIMNNNYKISKWKLIMGDILIHHYPMYRMLNQNYVSYVCGRYLLIPVAINISITKLRKINKDEIYDINYNKLLLGPISVFSYCTLYAHRKFLLCLTRDKINKYL